MKILVTGANGFVGNYLLEVLQVNGVSIIAVDVNINENLLKYNNIKAVQCDLDESWKLPKLISDRDIDCCIHLAWQGANGPSRGDFDIQISNIQRTIRLCEILPKMNIGRFVGIGTLAEKDVGNYIPRDGATPNLVSCYGVAKMTAQYMSKIICTSLKIDHIWCQLSNLYGIGDKSNNFVNFASKLMLNGKRPSFTAGEQMYDFVYITDMVKAIYLAAIKGKPNTCYYIGSGNQRKLKFFIQDIRDAIDPNIKLYLGEVPFNGVCLPDDEFDCSKLQADTGYKAEVTFKDGISKTVQWLRNNMESENGKN